MDRIIREPFIKYFGYANEYKGVDLSFESDGWSDKIFLFVKVDNFVNFGICETFRS